MECYEFIIDVCDEIEIMMIDLSRDLDLDQDRSKLKVCFDRTK
jgi:hypothetical protein